MTSEICTKQNKLNLLITLKTKCTFFELIDENRFKPLAMCWRTPPDIQKFLRYKKLTYLQIPRVHHRYRLMKLAVCHIRQRTVSEFRHTRYIFSILNVKWLKLHKYYLFFKTLPTQCIYLGIHHLISGSLRLFKDTCNLHALITVWL